MKKEIYNDNLTDEILRINREKINRERAREIALKKEQIKRNNRINKIDEILTIFIAVVMLVLLLIVNYHFFGGKNYEDAINYCEQTGMSRTWCEAHNG